MVGLEIPKTSSQDPNIQIVQMFKLTTKMQDNKIKAPIPAHCLPAVSGSVLALTENRFIELFSSFPNTSEGLEDDKKVVFFTLNRNIDNDFYLSYHLKFPQKNVQFNFWFDKICYLNSKESVSISFFNGNEPKEGNRLKNILTTSDFNIFKEKVNDLLIQYK